MNKIIADASIPLLKELFEPAFSLECYHSEQELHALLSNQDILICRSTLKVNAALLKNYPIKCVATASSGIDHIDESCLRQRQISLFDAKGTNASAVADYVLASIAYLESQHMITGNKIGIIGFGHVGKAVYYRLKQMNFEIVAYDPFLNLKTFPLEPFEVLTQCNLICIHPNLHEIPPHPSKNLINANFFEQLNPHTVLINASRGSIVNETDLLKTSNAITYCTDVYTNEPNINKNIVNFATLCTPHIAGHTIEAKKLAIIKVCQDIYQHFNLIPPLQQSEKGQEKSLPENWQKLILSLYNPYQETLLLKNAVDVTRCFLQLRKAHHRHGFL